VEENGDYNQFWYSPYTIENIIKELEACATRIAFLSTPSIYFSLPEDSALRKNSHVFEYDRQWLDHPNFVFYDFNKPEELPVELHHSFDCVVADPPFITAEAWRLYIKATKMLLQPGGKFMGTAVIENEQLLKEELGAAPCVFKPCIPNLVLQNILEDYRYRIYLNFEPQVLSNMNPEIHD